MKFVVELSQQAKLDLAHNFRWIKASSKSGAESWLAAFELLVMRLEQMPSSFPSAPESRYVSLKLRQGFFRTRHGRPYRVIFYVDGKIVRVTHLRGPQQQLLDSDDFETN